MIEQIPTVGNLLKAMHQVYKNHVSAGIDHISLKNSFERSTDALKYACY